MLDFARQNLVFSLVWAGFSEDYWNSSLNFHKYNIRQEDAGVKFLSKEY